MSCPAGKEKGVLKRLARSFKPGEDRLAGLATLPLPPATADASPGLPILADANAYLECCVTSRMEAGDHWVVYAQVG